VSVFTAFSTPSHVLQSLEEAKAGGYALGIKLVRGAYHPFEVAASESPETCPVWAKKEDTDSCYNQCIGLLLTAVKGDIAHKIPRIGLLFGTHNSESCTKILNGLVHEGIATERDGLVVVGAEAAERCAIGQLFGLWRCPSFFGRDITDLSLGMSDALTDKLVYKIRSPSPFVIK
jgi:proline dehydrogenase